MLSLLILSTFLFVFLTFYTYIGYPILLAILNIFFKKKIQSGEIEPHLTMIIPTYNEADVIQRKIENSLQINYDKDKLQILIIDDDSDDGTPNIIEEYADEGIELISKPKRSGKMESLQVGVARADGDLLVMSDASPSYTPDAIRKMVRHFNDPEIGIVIGKLAVWDAENSVAKPAGLYWRYESQIRKLESRIGSTIGMHGNMYLIRKHLFPQLSKDTINDEWSIAMRTIQKGFRIVYEPNAISYDDVSKKMHDEFKRRIRINAGRYQAFFGKQNLWPWNAPLVIFEIISHKLSRLLLPFFMLGALLCNIFAVLIPSAPMYMVILLGLQSIFYGLAFIGYVLEQRGISLKLANFAYYLVSSNIAALLGFMRFMRQNQSVMWEKSEKSIG